MGIRFLLLVFLLGQNASFFGQMPEPPSFFDEVDGEFPHHPAGLAAAVAWEHGRWQWIGPNMPAACTGKPIPLGYMGWLSDGAGVFRANLHLPEVSWEGTLDSLWGDPRKELRLWHRALDEVMLEIQDPEAEDWLWAAALLSTIPTEEMCGSSWPLAFWLDEVGRSWHALGGPKVALELLVPEGLPEAHVGRSANDPLAAWNPAPSCNFNSRNGVSPSAITVHTMQGSFAGTIAWFQHCPSNVSCHYLVRSSDGYILQMVDEANRAWHVGTENSYTVGIEHEGFVSNPLWYTDSMYEASIGLSQRIALRHGIDSLRTAWWPWTAATQYRLDFRPGSCTRIKGHQHYPNQTHTDPGVHWDWFRFARGMAAPAMVDQLQGPTGNVHYPTSGLYPDDALRAWKISVPNGRIRLQFSHFDTEADWDYLFVFDGEDADAPLVGTFHGNHLPPWVESSGQYLYLLFASDCATRRSGFQASWQQLFGQQADTLAPFTQLLSGLSWVTGDFSQAFLDFDAGGSGLHQAFWLAASHDGQDYRGIPGKGMLAEFFDGSNTLLPSGWVQVSGSWQQGSGRLVQQQLVPEAILSMPLNQTLGGRFYAWRSALHSYNGQGGAAMYFKADAAAGPGRNHSLKLSWDVNGTAKLERCSQGQCTALMGWQVNVMPGVTHHWMVALTDSTARVWFDGQWLGEAPVASISGGQAWVSVEALQTVFALEEFLSGPERLPNQPLWIETQAWPPGHLPNSNAHPSLAAGKVFSLVSDAAGNVSPLESLSYNIDFSPPSTPAYVLDGIFEDLDSLYSQMRPGSWGESEDPHSGLAAYAWCLGGMPGACNLLGWQETAGLRQINQPMALTEGSWTFLSVKAKNQAGLFSGTAVSDGAVYLSEPSGIGAGLATNVRVWPNPFSGEIFVQGLGLEGKRIKLLDIQGRLVEEIICNDAHEEHFRWQINRPADGVYVLDIEGLPRLRLVCSGKDNF